MDGERPNGLVLTTFWHTSRNFTRSSCSPRNHFTYVLTSQKSTPVDDQTAAPVAEKLDPFQAYLPYKLFRDSTRTVNGKVVKDLTYLNRDLSKVIMLDTNPEHAELQPDNAIIIPAWDGKSGASGLVDLIPFLECEQTFSLEPS